MLIIVRKIIYIYIYMKLHTIQQWIVGCGVFATDKQPDNTMNVHGNTWYVRVDGIWRTTSKQKQSKAIQSTVSECVCVYVSERDRERERM